MEILYLEKDGRCRWLENQVLRKLFPAMRESILFQNRKPMYLIEDWVSNDSGKVGADLGWLRSLGIPLLPSVHELPAGSDYVVVNTGYDAIVDEENEILQRGIEYIDAPCPYIRKIRERLEASNGSHQIVLLCEQNHIIIKNYRSIFPEDLILVQRSNYRERITQSVNGKPLHLVPYVTFLTSHVNEIAEFIQQAYPNPLNRVDHLGCMWSTGPQSPITEIEKLSSEQLNKVQHALLITMPGSTNKSLMSLLESLEYRGLNVVCISSLEEFMAFEADHPDARVLLVRSPIPNQAEQPILQYLMDVHHSYHPAISRNL